MPSTAKARFAQATSHWKGFPAGKPIWAAVAAGARKWEPAVTSSPIPTATTRPHSRAMVRTRSRVRCLVTPMWIRAPMRAMTGMKAGP